MSNDQNGTTVVRRGFIVLKAEVMDHNTNKVIRIIEHKVIDPPASEYDEYIEMTAKIGAEKGERFVRTADIERRIEQFAKESIDNPKTPEEMKKFSDDIKAEIKEIDDQIEIEKKGKSYQRKIVEFIIKKEVPDEDWKELSHNNLKEWMEDYERFIGAEDALKNAEQLLPTARLRQYASLMLRQKI